jgi:hypothetical protein
MEFKNKEDLKLIRNELLNKLYLALKDSEPNAQIMKFAKEILDESNIPMVDNKEGASIELEKLFKNNDEKVSEYKLNIN